MTVDDEDKKLNDKSSLSFGQRGATLIEEQIKALKEVRSIIDVVMCVDPAQECSESICNLMKIAYQKVNGILAETGA